jgi:hypothetical protein
MPLECGQSLQQGESIWSTNEQYRLTMQDDGNLVLYDGKNQPHWASNTWRHGEPPYRTTMQDDGNLVLYDVRGTATWASNTWGKGPSRCAPRFRTRRCLCQTSIFWLARAPASAARGFSTCSSRSALLATLASGIAASVTHGGEGAREDWRLSE